jgi:diaminopimelate epimerase
MINSKTNYEIYFERYSATQNTFIIGNAFDSKMNAYQSSLGESKKKELVRQLCQGIYGFKSDGLLFIKPHEKFDFEWEFFNSDGSSAEMCGNAARCATLCHFQHSKKENLSFLTIAGEIQGQILEKNKVKVKMPPISLLEPATVEGLSGYVVNSGVPHFVIKNEPNLEEARKVRSSKYFSQQGSNVTYIHDQSGKWSAATFERGVEDFTRACGTGAVAAAAVINQILGMNSTRSIEMPGGELVVEKAEKGERPFLIGEVNLDFRISHLQILKGFNSYERI